MIWKSQISGIPLFSNTSVCWTTITVFQSTMKTPFTKISRRCYYYSNEQLNNVAINFDRNDVQCKTKRKLNLQFDPNYKLLNFPYTSKSISALASDDSTNVIKSVAKSALACHPRPDISHIPFEVKPKIEIAKKSSVLQRMLQDESPSLKQLCAPYLALTKPQLTFLIMLSSICSYALAPNSTSLSEFVCLTLGTLMASGSANAINMGREFEYDRLMIRTQARPVVNGSVTPNEAFAFASIIGLLGCTILYYGVNPVVAALGLTNIVLYSWIYTSLKRVSILNTWVGAVVGAIPPLMGWAACSSLSDPGAWCLALLLYAWQFPHFNSLSHNIRDEYKRAGYVMAAFENPKLNARVALRYSVLMFLICFGLCYYDVTDPLFMLDSSVLNGWMAYMSFRFWWQQRLNYSHKVQKSGGPSQKAIDLANFYAKKTFWSSIWQLPVVLVLAMLHKKGQWDRLFKGEERHLTA
ncbi:hypothetical protein KL944_002478 [Ogataea haglerorum]|nr:hypothetical protein KL944_002478 [Ogataea haglerorum]